MSYKPESKPSCRSQFLAIRKEVEELLEMGYRKATIYRFFHAKGKITMTYESWRKVTANPDKEKPFSNRKLPPIEQVFTAEKDQHHKKVRPDETGRTFNHSNTSYLNTPNKDKGVK